MNYSRYLSHGFFNDAHKPQLIGIPLSARFIGPEDALKEGMDKVGYWQTGYLIDRNDQASWLNPDGSKRFRMLHDGTVTDEPWHPTQEEFLERFGSEVDLDTVVKFDFN